MFEVVIIDMFHMAVTDTYRRTYYRSNTDHRLYGPACMEWYNDGALYWEQWLCNGRRHRENGPVYSQWYKDGSLCQEEWRIDEKFHRVGGPARLWLRYDGTPELDMQEYWLHGIELTTETKEWAVKLGISDIMNMSPEETTLFKISHG